jgi:protein-disulfide isomerase
MPLEHAAALRALGYDPGCKDKDWRLEAGILAKAYMDKRAQLQPAQQGLQQIASVLRSLGMSAQLGQEHAAGPSNVIKLERMTAPAALTSLTCLAKRPQPQSTSVAAKKPTTEQLPASSLIQLQRIVGIAVSSAAQQQPVPTVEVWRIIYQGKQYFTEVDAVLLLGNALDKKLFSRVRACGMAST